jgi:NAD(P)H-hydrate epimerase
MSKAYTREQMRELDRRAVEDYGVPGVVLMENAGRGAAQIALEMLGDPIARLAVIFCGKGNNGGDGFVIARHLHNTGVGVRLIVAFDPARVDPHSDAGVNLRIADRMGLTLIRAEDPEGLLLAAGLAREADLIVDALLGTGLSGEVREPYLALIRLINAEDKPVLAVDIPSGLDANTGCVLRAAVRATRTATFAGPKLGFTLADAPAHTGQVDVVDIGVPRELLDGA